MTERQGPKLLTVHRRSCEGCTHYSPERTWDCRPDDPAYCYKLGQEVDGTITPANCPYLSEVKTVEAAPVPEVPPSEVPQEVKEQFPDIIWYKDYGWIREYPAHYVACSVQGAMWQHRSFPRADAAPALAAAIEWIEARAPQRKSLVFQDTRMAPWVVLSYRTDSAGVPTLQGAYRFSTESSAQRYFDECAASSGVEVYLLEARAFKENRS